MPFQPCGLASYCPIDCQISRGWNCPAGRRIYRTPNTHGEYFFIEALPGKVSKRDGSAGIWERGIYEKKACVYIRCPICGKINLVWADEVNQKGFVRLSDDGESIKCVTCVGCEGHFWPRLKKWAKRRKK